RVAVELALIAQPRLLPQAGEQPLGLGKVSTAHRLLGGGVELHPGRYPLAHGPQSFTRRSQDQAMMPRFHRAQFFRRRRAIDMARVLYQQDGRIARITLNRPEVLNAIDDELPHELAAAVERADADPAVHVIVLSGAGRAFCSGYDLHHYAQADAEHRY